MMTVTFSDNDALFAAAATRLAAQLSHVLSAKGTCCLAIVGGRSTPAVLSRLVQDAKALKGRIEIFWLDERVSQTEKNYEAALPALQSLVDAGMDVVWHALRGTTETGIMEECSRALERMELLCGAQPRFDVVLLSAGEDGHVASLFPHHASLARTDVAYLLEEESPKPPLLRVSVSPALIRSALHAIVLVVGDKKLVAQQIADNMVPIEECPVKLALEATECVVFVCVR